MDYRQAGVDIEEGYAAVERYKEHAASTMVPGVLNGLGSFAGMFSLKEIMDATGGMDDPVLVSGTDGVGTKLDVAFRMGKYDSVGIDCVAMCVNDVLCHGAKPLFFLDYLACGKLDAAVASDLVKGVAAGCREAECALLGGETAEMPGFYDEGKYDIAGFSVGVADRKSIISGTDIQEGDILVGLLSTGPHSNGYSLIRKALPDLDEDFGGVPIGAALLEPTRIYVKGVRALMRSVRIKGMAHITGGGFYENIPRMFARPLAAVIDEGAWSIPPIFERIAYGAATNGTGPLSGEPARAEGARLLGTDAALRRQMFNTYNMGVGFVLALDPADADRAIRILEDSSYPAVALGRVAASEARRGDGPFISEVRFADGGSAGATAPERRDGGPGPRSGFAGSASQGKSR